jgi:type IV pilus assembly protein PilC
MATYKYQSMNGTGKTVRGEMEAINLPDLEMRLKRMDLDLIDASQVRKNALRTGRGKIRRQELINFCFHLEQLTASGVTILEALDDLRDGGGSARFKEVVSDLIENIEGGLQLSEALERHPAVFDKSFTSLVMAGEQSGKVADVLKRLTENLKWQDEFASQTKKIVMYPAFVGTVVVAVTFLMMIFLVPQLTSFIKSMGQELPLHTRALIAVSNFLVHYWWLVLGSPIAFVVGLNVLLRVSPRARYRMDDIKLRVHVIGPLIRKMILARFATFFALMYASGIPILDCIRLSEDIVGNQVMADGLRRAQQFIGEGQTVTTAFENTRLFPPLVIRMLRVGEATGGLDTALRNVSYFYDREIKELIEKVQTMIEPVMTLVLGIVIAWVMLSVLGPLYDTISKIKT